MKSQYINAAANVVSNKQQLINMVSKRVRELSAGSRPMVEVDYEIGQMGLADIALAEIAAGKLTAQAAVELDTAHAA
ncbi:MAG: DNA-directed RNA polymerase subunit omega [Proteobacteria bacterium]|nr:DNA-directed RNA polymerase subunit omega [Pseudomonadota bacterium]